MIDADARCAHREFEARLRPFVARRVSVSDVDDVLQDVFLRMERGLGSLREEDRFGPWLYRVARSAIAEHRRARARHPLAEGPGPEEAIPAPDAESEGEAEREVALCVAPFVAMLPSPYREALTLAELQGVAQKDAAEMLGISASGARTRVQRGRQRLRELLQECCDIALDARGRIIACEPRPNRKAPEGCCR